MNGKDILQGGDRRDFERLSKMLLLTASKARHDFKVFFDFVMEEENTKEPIEMLAHQRVAAEFLLAHRRAVIMMPRGHSKSFLILALLLWNIGRDPNFRGAVVSATQDQAAKTVMAARQYIESNPRLRLVFPNLAPSTRKGESWTQTEITVRRPPGTRDPTLVAKGMDGAVRGSRLKFIVVDDILTEENTATEDGRQKVIKWVDGALLQTKDVTGDTRAYLVGTAMHPADLLHYASHRQRGWATMKMDVVGNIVTLDDADPAVRIDGGEHWDTELLRPGPVPYERLTAHDPDPRNLALLWPSKFPHPYKRGERCGPQDLLAQQKALATFKASMHPVVFQKEQMMLAKDEENAWFRTEWFEWCKDKAREMGFFALVDSYDGQYPTFTGVDLGINIGEHNDDTSFFTFCVLPTGHRRILDIEYGKFDGARKMQKVGEKHRQFGSWVIMVESNGGQKMLVEWALDNDVSLPVRAQQTTAMKTHVEMGIPALATEVYNKAWLIPNRQGVVDERVQRWIDEAVNYVPDKHTGDVLMSSYLAQQGARQWGIGTGAQATQGDTGLGDFLSR